MKTKILIIFIFSNLILNTILGVENLDNIISSNYGVYQASDLKLLYGQNTQEKISIASITKLMSAVVAIENINDLNEQIIIDYSLISNNLDPELAVAGIYDGQTLTYYDLLATMLVPSGADSAIYLSEITFNDSDKFIAEMNKKAHELQMNNTNFSNVTGLDDQDNYSTIEDLAKLLKYVLENNTLKEIISLKEYTTTDGELTVSSTISRSAKRYGIDLNYILGGKTGTTEDAGRPPRTSSGERGRRPASTAGPPAGHLPPVHRSPESIHRPDWRRSPPWGWPESAATLPSPFRSGCTAFLQTGVPYRRAGPGAGPPLPLPDNRCPPPVKSVSPVPHSVPSVYLLLIGHRALFLIITQHPAGCIAAFSQGQPNSESGPFSVPIRAISSPVREKSKTAKFSSIRSRWADFGITAMPFWTRYRKAVWAAVLPWAAPISIRIGS